MTARQGNRATFACARRPAPPMLTRLLASTLACVAVLLAAASAAHARAGDLDLRYGTRGLAKTSLLEGGAAAVRDGRGGLFVAGGGPLPGVARITARGRLDTRFAKGRGVTLFDRASYMIPEAIGVGRDGRVQVLAGAARTDRLPAVLARVTPGGTRQTVSFHPGPFQGPIAAGVLRPDGGAFLLSGRPCLYEDERFAREYCVAARARALRPDGAADAAFGGGTVDLTAPPAPASTGTAMALRPDGRLLVATAAGNGERPRLVQLLPDGRPDPSFGTGGLVELPFPADAVRVAKDGTVVVAGGGGHRRLARVLRLRPDGARDDRFGRGAPVTLGRTPSGLGGTARDVVVDGDGLYVAADAIDRYDKGPRDDRPTVFRLTPGGRPDAAFGRRGVSNAIPAPRSAYDTTTGAALVLDGRGGVLVVGQLLSRGSNDPFTGCGIRDDTCASKVRLGVWRLKTRRR